MENKHVLMAEDNPDDEELTLRALKKSNIPLEVKVTHDGVETLDYLFGTGAYAGRDVSIMPILVLLDLKLPKIDGLEVLRCLRADERTRLLPTVVFTSSNEEQDIIESYARGVNSYIRKPVDFNHFTEVVRQIGLYWLITNIPPKAMD